MHNAAERNQNPTILTFRYCQACPSFSHLFACGHDTLTMCRSLLLRRVCTPSLLSRFLCTFSSSFPHLLLVLPILPSSFPFSPLILTLLSVLCTRTHARTCTHGHTRTHTHFLSCSFLKHTILLSTSSFLFLLC